MEKKKNGFIATLEGEVYMRTDLFECMTRHGERVTASPVVRSDDEAYEETLRLFTWRFSATPTSGTCNVTRRSRRIPLRELDNVLDDCCPRLGRPFHRIDVDPDALQRAMCTGPCPGYAHAVAL